MTPEERHRLVARIEDMDGRDLVDFAGDLAMEAREAYERADVAGAALRGRMEEQHAAVALGEHWRARQDMERDYAWPDGAIDTAMQLLLKYGEEVSKYIDDRRLYTLIHSEDWGEVASALRKAGVEPDKLFMEHRECRVKNSLALSKWLAKLGDVAAGLQPMVTEKPKGRLQFLERTDDLPFD